MWILNFILSQLSLIKVQKKILYNSQQTTCIAYTQSTYSWKLINVRPYRTSYIFKYFHVIKHFTYQCSYLIEIYWLWLFYSKNFNIYIQSTAKKKSDCIVNATRSSKRKEKVKIINEYKGEKKIRKKRNRPNIHTKKTQILFFRD